MLVDAACNLSCFFKWWVLYVARGDLMERLGIAAKVEDSAAEEEVCSKCEQTTQITQKSAKTKRLNLNKLSTLSAMGKWVNRAGR